MTVRLIGTLTAAAAAAALMGSCLAYLTWALAGCFVAFVPLPDAPICAVALWPAPWMPLALLVVSLIAFAVTLFATLHALIEQFEGARRQRRALDRNVIALPSRLATAAESCGLGGKILCVVAHSPVACTIGLIHPRVYVSTRLLDSLGDSELIAVLTHEAEHVRGRDPLVLGTVRVAHRLAFVWPLVRYLADRMWLDLEARADARAIDAVGRGPFLVALYRMLEAGTEQRPAPAVGSIGGLLSDRIALIAGMYNPRPRDPRATRRTVLSTLLLSSVVTLLVAATFRAGGGFP